MHFDQDLFEICRAAVRFHNFTLLQELFSMVHARPVKIRSVVGETYNVIGIIKELVVMDLAGHEIIIWKKIQLLFKLTTNQLKFNNYICPK